MSQNERLRYLQFEELLMRSHKRLMQASSNATIRHQMPSTIRGDDTEVPVMSPAFVRKKVHTALSEFTAGGGQEEEEGSNTKNEVEGAVGAWLGVGPTTLRHMNRIASQKKTTGSTRFSSQRHKRLNLQEIKRVAKMGNVDAYMDVERKLKSPKVILSPKNKRKP